MVLVNISFPTFLEDCDSENDNIDVFVKLEDGYTHTLVLITPKNLEYLMEKEQKNYFGPAHPYVIVKKLTKEIIEETIQAYVEKNEAYWLKFYHFAGDIDKSVFDQLQAGHMENENWKIRRIK